MFSHNIGCVSDIESLEEEIFDGCWIDILSFTKKDWDEIELIASNLKSQGIFKGDDFKCIVAAVAVFVDNGKGLRCSDH